MEYFFLDFETGSKKDLTKVGAVRYASDRSTYVQCMGFSIRGEFGLMTQQEIERRDKNLVSIASNPNVIFVAHNAFFDRMIWYHIMHKRLGYPDVPLERWRCTMAKAFSHGLPGNLKMAGRILMLENQKDLEGQASMLELCRPLKTKLYKCFVHGYFGGNKKPCECAIKVEFHDPHYPPHAAKFEKHYDYCIQDVRAMVELNSLLMDLAPSELELWFIDQRMNEEGVLVDMPSIIAAIDHVQAYKDELVGEYQQITGLTSKPAQRALLKKWLEDQDVDVKDTKKSTFLPMLAEGTLDKDVARVMEISLASNKSSLAKYIKMEQLANSFGIITELCQYHAAHTGRFGGRGFQPQNLPRPVVDPMVVLDALGLDYDSLKMIYPKVAEALSSALRSMMISRPGMKFIGGDFAQIESVVLAWLVGDQDKLDRFASDFAEKAAGLPASSDAYCRAATPIFGRPITPKEKNERQVGKCSELGLGFEGGIHAFDTTAKGYGIDLRLIATNMLKDATYQELDSAKYTYTKFYLPKHKDGLDEKTGMACDIIKQRWREANPKIVAFWREIEDAATEAVRIKKQVSCANGKLLWFMQGRFLVCRLPSGRRMRYPYPVLKEGRKGDQLTYKSNDYKIAGWKSTYGGSLTENIVQAIARDLMRDALIRLAHAGYTPRLTVHDEVLCEVRKDFGSLAEFRSIMLYCPKWAKGIPINVDCFEGDRYGK